MAQQINLINPALRKTLDPLSALPLLGATGVMLVVLLTASTILKQQADAVQAEADKNAAELKTAQAKLVEMGKSVTDLKPNPELLDELANSRAMLNLREEVIGALEGGSLRANKGFADFMRGFARQVPSGLWLTGFVLNAGGSDIEIRGRMMKSTALPEYIHRLNSEAAFQGRSFSSLAIQRPEGEMPEARPAGGAVAVAGQAATPAPAPYVEFVLRTKPVEAEKQAASAALSGALGKALEIR